MEAVEIEGSVLLTHQALTLRPIWVMSEIQPALLEGE